jgi:hypothetical protein
LFRFNIPVTKVDEERRLVYGLVTEQIVDQSGEIMDYETSKAYFEEWSSRIAKATDGLSLGNLRLMHQPIVAGKITELLFDDALKQISCVARIVSDEVWKLVVEGCLTGFSIGGKYVRKWKDKVDKAVTWFTVRPVEISVVDNPCVETATFEFQKADGSIELRKFHAGDGDRGDEKMLTEEQIRARAEELAKAAGTPDAVEDFLVEAQTLLEGELEVQRAAVAGGDEEQTEELPTPTPEEAAAELEVQRAAAAERLVQVWLAPDGTTHVKKAEAVDHVIANPAQEPPAAETPVEKALREAREGAAGEAGEDDLSVLLEEVEVARKGLAAALEHVAPGLVEKGIYEVRGLLQVLQELSYLVSSVRDEAMREADGSPVPAAMLAGLRQLAAAAVAMAQEEVAEMLTLLGGGSDWADAIPPGVVELAAFADVVKANEALVQKVGARHSAADAKKIQAMHDSSVELGASCGETGKAAVTDEPGAEELSEEEVRELPAVKAILVENRGLQEEVRKAVDGIAEMGTKMAEMREELDKLKKTPQPLPPRTDAVVLRRNGANQTITQEDLEKMSSEDKADLAIRLQQMQPTHIGGN